MSVPAQSAQPTVQAKRAAGAAASPGIEPAAMCPTCGSSACGGDCGQQTAGGSEAGGAPATRPVLQTKAGAAHDAYELEADRVADAVVRDQPVPAVTTRASHSAVQRQDAQQGAPTPPPEQVGTTAPPCSQAPVIGFPLNPSGTDTTLPENWRELPQTELYTALLNVLSRYNLPEIADVPPRRVLEADLAQVLAEARQQGLSLPHLPTVTRGGCGYTLGDGEPLSRVAEQVYGSSLYGGDLEQGRDTTMLEQDLSGQSCAGGQDCSAARWAGDVVVVPGYRVPVDLPAVPDHDTLADRGVDSSLTMTSEGNLNPLSDNYALEVHPYAAGTDQGITIGLGYDLGLTPQDRALEEIRADLEAAHVDAETIQAILTQQALVHAATDKATAVQNAINALGTIQITQESALALFNLDIVRHHNRAMHRITFHAMDGGYADTWFEVMHTLDPRIIGLLDDMEYRGDLDWAWTAAPFSASFRQAVLTNNPEALASLFEGDQASQWQDPLLAGRTEKRGQYLRFQGQGPAFELQGPSDASERPADAPVHATACTTADTGFVRGFTGPWIDAAVSAGGPAIRSDPGNLDSVIFRVPTETASAYAANLIRFTGYYAGFGQSAWVYIEVLGYEQLGWVRGDSLSPPLYELPAGDFSVCSGE